MVTYNYMTRKPVINAETLADREIVLSDNNGFMLTTQDFLFLCNFDSNVTLEINIDTTDLVYEANEENNKASLHNLHINPAQCIG